MYDCLCGYLGAVEAGEVMSVIEPPPQENIVMIIELPPAEFSKLPTLLHGALLRVAICLFSQGVNEEQTKAN